MSKMAVFSRREMLRASAIAGVGAATLEMEGCNAQQWIQTALTDLPTVLQVVQGIVGIIGAAQGGVITASLQTEITNVFNQAQKDLGDAKTFITQYQAQKDPTLLAKIDGVLIDAQNNLSNILSDFHVSDPTLVSTVAASLGVAITTITAIQALIPAPPAATTARLALAQANGSNAIKEAFNLVVGKSYPSAVLKVS